jgi:hypothetical protein
MIRLAEEYLKSTRRHVEQHVSIVPFRFHQQGTGAMINH